MKIVIFFNGLATSQQNLALYVQTKIFINVWKNFFAPSVLVHLLIIILLTSSNNQIYEFRIPNIYN